MIVETIVVFAKKVAEKIAVGIVADMVKNKGAQLLSSNATDYTKELENTIYNTIRSYDETFGIQNEGSKFAFYKSEALIQSLLTIKFIGRDTVSLEEVKKQLEQNPNIIVPKEEDVFRFLSLFEEKCKENSTLIKHQFSNNYKEAVFEILGVVDSIQSTLNRVISEIRTSLTEEYFAQLNEIEQNINSFKPATALERLELLEKRINQGNRITPEIESRLLFLRGICILETSKDLTGAQLIVRAYLALKNSSLKTEAAISYLNLKETNNALELALDILKTDPYNATAHFLQLVIRTNDFRELWSKIPQSVKDKRGFTVNVIYYLLNNNLIAEFPLQEFGLKLPNQTNEKFTHANITLWEKIAFIKVHNYFSSVKEFSIDEKGKLRNFNIEGLDELIALLGKFFSTIKGTEVYGNYPALRFYYSFCRHLSGDNSFDSDEFKEDYLKLKEDAYQFDLLYAEYLANCGKLEDAIKLLNESEFDSDEVVFLHRIIYARANGQEENALRLLKEHVQSIEEIDFANLFNLNNLFHLFNSQNSSLKEEFDNILKEKSFQSPDLKDLLRITMQINYFPNEVSKDEVVKTLSQLATSFNSERNVVFYIAQLLFKVEGYKECVTALAPIVLSSKQNGVNLLYAQASIKGNVELKSLLKFLEEIRIANENNLYDFLAIEHHLRNSIDDITSIVNIAWRGVKQYPNVEYFHSSLLSALERKGTKTDIGEYVKKHLKKDFRNQEIGIWVCAILNRNGFELAASNILYELALKPTNYEARTAFARTLNFPTGFFIDYEEVEMGSYVKLVSRTNDNKLIALGGEDKYKLIGKKRGDVVMVPEKLSAGLKEFRVSRIMNEHLFLFEQILEEAKDSNSEIGLQTFDFTNEKGEFDREAFEEQIKRLGSEDSKFHQLRQERIDAYNRGELSFSEVCRGVFSDKALECYQFLTSNMFFALPAYHNSLLRLSNEEVFVLDFTSLILLSDLKKQCGISIDKKFIVSANLVTAIKAGLIEYEAYPASKMSLTIIDGQIRPIFYPEDYHQTQIEKYKGLLQFVSDNCIEKVNEEKVEFLSFLENRKRNEPYFDCLIDSAMFCTNLGYTLVSNDRFILNNFKQLNPKIISPENFLRRHFKMNFPKEIVDYFVEKHYVGIVLNKDVLLNEYRKLQLGQANSFNSCLSSLKFRWSYALTNMIIAVKFLKEVYTIGLSTDADRFILAQTIFINLLDGCSQNEKAISIISITIQSEFALLGNSLDTVFEAYESVLRMYGR